MKWISNCLYSNFELNCYFTIQRRDEKSLNFVHWLQIGNIHIVNILVHISSGVGVIPPTRGGGLDQQIYFGQFSPKLYWICYQTVDPVHKGRRGSSVQHGGTTFQEGTLSGWPTCQFSAGGIAILRWRHCCLSNCASKCKPHVESINFASQRGGSSDTCVRKH